MSVAREWESSCHLQGLEKACGLSVPAAIFDAMMKKHRLASPRPSWPRLPPVRGLGPRRGRDHALATVPGPQEPHREAQLISGIL
jgi:hypothetical protein